MLTRGLPGGTRYYACNACKNPCDGMVYPFTTVKAMETWVKARRTTRGIAYTASPKLTKWLSGKEICPTSAIPRVYSDRSCAFSVGLIAGIVAGGLLLGAMFVK